MTDELVQLVNGDAQVITAVLAHELGHVQQRHGLRMLVQVTVLGTLASAVLGDFSTLLASVPVLMGHASYSRDAEREADAAAVQLLKRAGISPLVMVTLFDKLNEKRGDKEGSWLGIAFASHPADAERIQFFKNAAAQ
jgi:predicted Zn-dependent protease